MALPTYAHALPPALWGFLGCTKRILPCINMPSLRLLQSCMRCRGKLFESNQFDWKQIVPPAYQTKSQLPCDSDQLLRGLQRVDLITPLVTYANATARVSNGLPGGKVYSESVFDSIQTFPLSICLLSFLTPGGPCIFCPTIFSCSFRLVSLKSSHPWTNMSSRIFRLGFTRLY